MTSDTVATGNIGYLTKRFPRLSETFILDEILGLEAAGIPLRLYALGHPGEPLTQSDVAKVASGVFYLHPPGGASASLLSTSATLAAHLWLLARAPRRYLGVLVYIARKRRHLSTFRHFAEAGRLAGRCERDRVVHLHAAFAHGPASVAHLVHLLTGLPFSFAAHAKDLYISAPDLLARKVAAAEFVLVCSKSAGGVLGGIAGPHAGKVRLAYHGVDTERFAPLSDRPHYDRPPRTVGGTMRALAVGRLVDKKGYPVLLDALGMLSRGGNPVTCTIIGGGPLRSDLESQAERLGLAGKVVFLGARTHEEVASEYREADVFIQASVVLPDGDRDGIPNSLLEAMASGLPVVGSRVGGIAELLVPGCGLLVAPDEPGELAEALARLAGDPQLCASLGTAAREHVLAHFDRLTCARALAPLFGARPTVGAPTSLLSL